MLDWLFGKKKDKKKDEKKTEKPSPTRQPKTTTPIESSDDWLYESLLQYLSSPLWKIPISSFIDENCIVFDAEEENKFAYTEIHNKFKKMIEEMVGNFINDIGVREDQIENPIIKGLKSKHRRVFEQLLLVDNFIVFKKLMVKRNKELELEALRQLEESEANASGGVNPKLAKLTLEKEQADIEHAIAISLSMEAEMKRLAEEEERALEEVLKLSEQEYQQSQTKVDNTTPATTQEKTEIISQPEEKKEQVIPKKTGKLEPLKAPKNPLISQTSDEIKQMLSQVKIDTNDDDNTKKLQKKSSFLPPLKPDQKFDSLNLEELIAEKEAISKKLENIQTAEPKQENLEERKKRLKAQRDLIIAKKKAENEAELKKFVEGGKGGK